MSGGLEALAMKEDDVTKMLAAGTHLGDANVHFQMADYVYKTKSDGTEEGPYVVSMYTICFVHCSSVDM